MKQFSQAAAVFLQIVWRPATHDEYGRVAYRLGVRQSWSIARTLHPTAAEARRGRARVKAILGEIRRDEATEQAAGV